MNTDISTVLKNKFNKNAEFLLTDSSKPDLTSSLPLKEVGFPWVFTPSAIHARIGECLQQR